MHDDSHCVCVCIFCQCSEIKIKRSKLAIPCLELTVNVNGSHDFNRILLLLEK